MPESDSTLQRIAAGDPDAPRACIARHAPLVWALVRRDCGCQADAEDLVQEIFIDLWANAARFDPAVATETTFVAMIRPPPPDRPPAAAWSLAHRRAGGRRPPHRRPRRRARG